jgi:diguanylate cyclase (GGDEF)-like protein
MAVPFPNLSTQRAIAGGYALVLALLLGAMLLVLTRMLEIKARMERLVQVQSVQIEQLHEMRTIARERYARLAQMALMRDPFERDEEFLHYRDLGAQFIKARDRLLALGLGTDSRAIWDEVRHVIRQDEDLHQQALAHMQADELDEARRLLVEDVRAVEAILLDRFNCLLEAKRRTGARALSETEAEYRRTLVIIVAATLFALAVGYAVARSVMRHSRATEHDLDEQRRMAEASATRLAWAAQHDALTGLVNRGEFEHRLRLLLEDARHNDAEHVLIYLDLDRFKIVNDTSGHVAGDELLRQAAALLLKRLRSGDTVARLGGDEFGLLLANCPLDKACAIAEQVRDDVAAFRFSWEGRVYQIGASMGLVGIDPHARDAAELLNGADAACYLAKEKGRNQVWVHRSGEEELLRRRGEMRWVERLRRAMEEGGLVLHHQRILPVRGDPGSPPLGEVLVRLVDEAGGLVPPMAFIPAAERYGLMPELDRWVLRATLDRLDAGALAGGLVPVINLSARTLADDRFLTELRDLLGERVVAAGRLGFEINETAAIGNLDRAMRFIRAARDLGCHVVLDDFGSGVSSFAYLKTLPVDMIKIDGPFVKDMARDRLDRTMVEAICRIGQEMGLKVIAEGVEDAETLALLREIGVDYAQGYAVHRPEPF